MIIQKEILNNITNITKNEKESNADCLLCFHKKSDAVFMNCGHGGNYNFLFLLTNYYKLIKK